MNHVQNQSPTDKSQAKIFAEQHAATAGQDLHKTFRSVKLRSMILTYIALGVSMPHQILYVISECTPWFDWSSLSGALETVGMLLIAGAVPVVSDLVIVNSIETISAVAASDASRWRAVGTIIPALGVSGYVNFAAPGPGLVKWLAAFLVTCILLSEIQKFIKPDFLKIKRLEEEANEQVEAVTDRVPRKRARSRKERILNLLADNPGMKVSEVAKKAGVSENYVYGVRREAIKVDA
jgi:hypothetical protein